MKGWKLWLVTIGSLLFITVLVIIFFCYNTTTSGQHIIFTTFSNEEKGNQIQNILSKYPNNLPPEAFEDLAKVFYKDKNTEEARHFFIDIPHSAIPRRAVRLIYMRNCVHS